MMPHRDGLSGRIRIGSGGTASIHLLPKAIAVVKRRMPDLDITVRIGNTQDILRDRESNLLDLAVVTLPASGRAFEVESFYRDELLAVAPKGKRTARWRPGCRISGGADAAFLRRRQ
ncbi:LysR substrate binding domain-containing protein [Rhizobium mongolense subsp. loessense]|uniref:LysR substrate binding domain-containing protein n=1 Tax=Rhizobium mongolense subsp. loessense TaxID=158890 RepID=A0A1G4RY46_9HYPH|nr:LysR substrate binding domain-containing protein [Rhizobium mongolense subsp. loessense]